MVIYTTISTDDDNYRLSAIIGKDGYEMASLEFRMDGEMTDYWDSDQYLYHQVYPFLMGKNVDIKIHMDLDDIIPSEDRPVLLELFKKGDEMGFFKNIMNLWEVMDSTEKHECKVCGKSFESNDDLFDHYDEKHN